MWLIVDSGKTLAKFKAVWILADGYMSTRKWFIVVIVNISGSAQVHIDLNQLKYQFDSEWFLTWPRLVQIHTLNMNECIFSIGWNFPNNGKNVGIYSSLLTHTKGNGFVLCAVKQYFVGALPFI